MLEAVATLPTQDYRVELPAFQGPLDLLLYLIKKEEVDIYDIPIARITRQYLKYIELMAELDLEVAGEFILMAATLIGIKTRMLLPRGEEEGEEADPREELMTALLEYKKYKEASELLREKALQEELNFVPPNPVEKIKGRVDLEPVTTLYDLLSAFRDIMKARPADSVHEVSGREVTIEDRIRHVLLFLTSAEHATFRELFDDTPTKLVAVVTFIALLELVRSHRVAIYQSLPFSELRVYRGDAFDAEFQDIDVIDITAIKETAR